MSRHKFELEVEVDDGQRGGHDVLGDLPPDEWGLPELMLALDEGVARAGQSKIVDYTDLGSAA